MRGGYSERPLSVYSEKLKQKFKIDFESLAKNYVKVLLKSGILLDHEIKKGSFVIFPTTFFSGLENLKYMLFGSKKNELTSITFDREGKIIVFISRSDYERILEPVSYYLLCENLAKVFEKSFLAFFEGDKKRAVGILGGD
ncbi:MAG: hypothetical protein ACE5K0_07355 [Candidatus Methanofastidiosia archaeon]